MSKDGAADGGTAGVAPDTQQGHFLGDFRVPPGPRACIWAAPLFQPETIPLHRRSRATGRLSASLPPPPSWGQRGPEQPPTRRTGLPTQERPGAFAPRVPRSRSPAGDGLRARVSLRAEAA